MPNPYHGKKWPEDERPWIGQFRTVMTNLHGDYYRIESIDGLLDVPDPSHRHGMLVGGRGWPEDEGCVLLAARLRGVLTKAARGGRW